MSSSIIRSMNCNTCGSSLEINPEDVIIPCRYCGSILTINNTSMKDHKFLPPIYSVNDAHKKIYEYIKGKLRLRGSIKSANIKVKKILIPYWVVKSQANSQYRGYLKTTRSKSETYTDSQGNRKTRTKSVTVYEPVERTINETRLDPRLSRLGVSIYGMDVLNKTVKNVVAREELSDFDPQKLLDEPEAIEFLSGQLKSHEIKEMIETMIQDDHRRRARSATTQLFDCRTNVVVNGMLFLHYPIFLAEYLFGDETYRVLMDGYSGKVLSSEIPITKQFRIITLIVTFLSLITIVATGIYVQPTFDQENDPGFAIYLPVLLLLGALGIKANQTAWSVLSREDN